MNMTIDTTIVTIHGAQRAKERRNVKNIRSAEKNISLAVQRGKRAEDCSSWERNFLAATSRDDCTAVAYNNFCYIFSSDDVCITLYPLPAWFGKKKRFDGKERIRNYKRYCRNNDCFCCRDIPC